MTNFLKCLVFKTKPSIAKNVSVKKDKQVITFEFYIGPGNEAGVAIW